MDKVEHIVIFKNRAEYDAAGGKKLHKRGKPSPLDHYTIYLKEEKEVLYDYAVETDIVVKDINNKTYKIEVPEDVTVADYSLFQDLIETKKISTDQWKYLYIPEGIERFGLRDESKYIFPEYPNLERVELPDGLTTLDSYAFSKAGSNTNAGLSITIPDTVVTMGQYIFQKSKIKNIILPKGITTIPYAFFYCCQFENTEFKIPSSVTTIDIYAFAYSNIVNAKLPEGLKVINGSAFGSSSYSGYNGILTLPKNLDVLGGYSFAYCKNIRILNLYGSSKLTTILDHTFYHCYNLKEVFSYHSFDTIRYDVFGFCGFSKIYLLNIKNLVSRTFIGCPSLKEVYVSNISTGFSIGGYIFTGCPSISDLYVQGITKATWDSMQKDTNWKGTNRSITIHCSDATFTV